MWPQISAPLIRQSLPDRPTATEVTVGPATGSAAPEHSRVHDGTRPRGRGAVARLKEESDHPLRSHGSLTLNQALLAAGLIDRIQVTIFPVINNRSQNAKDRIFEGTGDFDPELIESHTLDGHTQELIYRPTPHT